MQIMAIFYSIIYIQYGAYTHHIIIGHSCVEYKEEVFVMIVYDRLWITLKKKNISQYALIKDYGIDKAQLQRLYYHSVKHVLSFRIRVFLHSYLYLHVNIVAHHRLQTIVEQCIKYLIHASAIRDFKLVIALVLYIVHMASDSGADTG